VDGLVGNSSSGLIEAPYLRKGTINIGDRQRGRLKAKSVIDCAPQREAIAGALERLYSPEFRETLKSVESRYGNGGASALVVETIARFPLNGILKKTFFDLPNTWKCNH
jgi:GDP/UDP-N,N'-diacetylbacillosamine 2-epimerase (hydrolysing)